MRVSSLPAFNCFNTKNIFYLLILLLLLISIFEVVFYFRIRSKILEVENKKQAPETNEYKAIGENLEQFRLLVEQGVMQRMPNPFLQFKEQRVYTLKGVIISKDQNKRELVINVGGTELLVEVPESNRRYSNYMNHEMVLEVPDIFTVIKTGDKLLFVSARYDQEKNKFINIETIKRF